MKYIVSAKLGASDKKFREIYNVVDDIVKNDDEKAKTSLLLAEDLAKAIEKRYIENLNKISSYEHGSSDVTVGIVGTKKGYVVRTFGKDVLYEEYGTGTRGLKKPHPRHKADGMNPYGSGRNIIHNGNKNNGKDAPYWYKLYRDFPGGNVPGIPNTDFGNEPIKGSDYVWKHNGIVTKGLPAGRFIYDSCQEYKASGGLSNKEVLTRTIKQNIKNNFKNRMNKEVKKLKSPSADYIQRYFEFKMFGGK